MDELSQAEQEFRPAEIVDDDHTQPSLAECERLAHSFWAPVSTAKACWLRFAHQGQSFRYLMFLNESRRLDAPALLNAFNDFLKRIDHPQRLYPLEYFYNDDTWQMVVAADWRSFWPVRRALGLPLRGDVEW